MEVIRDLFIDWALFSLLEAFICLYFLKIYNNNIKIDIWNILYISIGSAIISSAFIPLLYQLVILIFIVGVLKVRHSYFNKISSIKVLGLAKYTLIYMMLMLIIETVYCVLMTFVLFFDLELISKFELFIFILPIKIIEILIIKYIKRRY